MESLSSAVIGGFIAAAAISALFFLVGAFVEYLVSKGVLLFPEVLPTIAMLLAILGVAASLIAAVVLQYC